MHEIERTKRLKKMLRGYPALAVVLLLGLLASLMIFWTHRIGERQSKVTAWAYAAMEMRVQTAMFHFWIEEAISGGRWEEVGKTFSYVDDALELSDAILAGGTSDHGTPLPPLDDPEIRNHVEIARSRLLQLKEIGLMRQKDPASSGIGSPLGEQFDDIFREFDKEAQTIEPLAERKWADDQATAGRLHLSIVAAWFLIIAASATGIYRGERRRRQAETALERTYEEMEQEVAERKRAEISLSMSEGEYRRISAHFRTLLDTVPDSITLISPDLKVIWANKGAAVQTRSDPVGQYCYQLHHDRCMPCSDCPALRSFRSGRMESTRIISPEGRHWDIRTVPVVKEGGTLEGVIEVASDVTEAVNLQAKTLRAAQLASLGELAAGVAHEINNPANGIISCAEILVNKSEKGSRVHEIGGRILKEGSRIASIVKSLLSFAREETEEKTPSSVQEVLADSIALTEALMRKEGITLNLDVPDDISPVLAQSQQLEQVFLNIINNARYALSRKYPGQHEGKVLGITAREITVDGRRCVRIKFRDQGTGIPANAINRVIEPFFSTKSKGEGTGLGLSISHGIVVQHGGTLAIDSVEGEFTEVMIELPLAE